MRTGAEYREALRDGRRVGDGRGVGGRRDDAPRYAIGEATKKARLTRDLLARHKIDCPTVTGAGTGTFEFEAASEVYTELQCGSYIFMDADYGRNLDHDGNPTTTFEPSLSAMPIPITQE